MPIFQNILNQEVQGIVVLDVQSKLKVSAKQIRVNVADSVSFFSFGSPPNLNISFKILQILTPLIKHFNDKLLWFPSCFLHSHFLNFLNILLLYGIHVSLISMREL